MDTEATKPWHTPAELALACGCTAEEIEALARRHHWTRVHGGHGSKIGVDPETVRRALHGTPATVHGSLPRR